MLRHKSVKTIDSPEFINLAEDSINPGISKCEVKLFYLGQNRNGSYFSKEVAEKMANTLPGTPIVGVYRQDVEDFGDHGCVITIENGEVSFSCKTIPYGFIAPDSKVWFQDFEDEDEFGNTIIHTYMMAVGYLWTGQYPELMSIFEDGGKGQSMELSENTTGHWATDTTKDIDFFIVDDTEFSKLCILGDDVEPCFEGAAVTAPELSKDFSFDEFNMSLYSMLKELRDSLEGGSKDMAKKANEEKEKDVVTTFAEKQKDDDKKQDDSTSGDDTSDDTADNSASDDAEDSSDDDKKKTPTKNSLDDDSKIVELENSLAETTSRFNEIVEKFNKLQADYESLKSEAESLKDFKHQRVTADKDALIAKYHMLSDEDKKDVIEHKDEYTLEEIESKLALAYVRNNVDFETVDGKPEQDGPSTTFSLDENVNKNAEVDPMVEALREASYL